MSVAHSLNNSMIITHGLVQEYKGIKIVVMLVKLLLWNQKLEHMIWDQSRENKS